MEDPNPDRLIRLPDGKTCTWTQATTAITDTFGKPALRVHFHELPSINDFLGIVRHPGAAQGFMKKWRTKGRAVIIDQARRQGFEMHQLHEYVTDKRGKISQKLIEEKFAHYAFTQCRLIVHYWRPDMRRYDVFSPFIKPIVDGMIDSCCMADDDQTRIQSVQTIFGGYDAALQLSDEAKDARRVKRITRKGSLLTPSRFWFDFHDLS